MKFLGTLALLSLAAAVELANDTEEVYTGDDTAFAVEEEEILGTPLSAIYAGDVPGKYSVEFAPGNDDDTNLWDNLEFEGYNFTIGERFEGENSTFVAFEVSNDNDNPTTNLSVLNLVESADGVLGMLAVSSFALGPLSLVSSLLPKWDPHVATGVNRLHEKGIKGKGITVGIIDSGIDTSHEVFAGKTINGYDFLSSKLNTDIRDVFGHGTMVASIFGGQSSKMVGVAPEATIRMYRVTSHENEALSQAIIDAAHQALKDGVNLISISIGRPMSSYKNDAAGLGQALQSIAKKIPVIVSAGNEGEKGTFQSQTGAAQNLVISVGSTGATSLVTWPMTIQTNNGDSYLFNYVSSGDVFPATGTFTAEYVADLCSHSGSSVVLFGSALTCKPEVLSTRFPTVKAFLSFDDAPNYVDGVSRFGLTDHGVEKWIQDKLASSSTFTVTMNSKSSPVMSKSFNLFAGRMSYFSTWGPTYTSDFCPSVLAPGGQMFLAKNGGGYAIADGTSFSTPYIAGVIALYLSQNPKATPDQVRKRLLSTANLMPLYKDNTVNTKYKDPVILQGAGFVNAWDFLYSNIELTSEPLLSWGDRSQRPKDGVGFLKWKNTGSKTRIYQVTHGKEVAVDTRSSARSPARFFPNLEYVFANSRLFNSPITLRPGQEALYKFWLTAPQGLDLSKSIAWQGYYRISDDIGLSITVPYMGIEGSAYAWNPIHAAPVYLTMTFANNDWPSVFYTLDYGSTFYSFDLVLDGFVVTGYRGDWSRMAGFIGGLAGTYEKVVDPKTVKTITLGFPKTDTDFGDFLVTITGMRSKATVPPGKYRILMRALRILASPQTTKLSDWQYYLSDTVRIKARSPKSITSVISSSTSHISSDSSTSLAKWANSTSSSTTKSSTLTSSFTSSQKGPGMKSSTPTSSLTVSQAGPGMKSSTSIEGVTVTTSCTTGCNEPKDQITVTTITKCSYGGCDKVLITIGETKTVKVTVTSCSNNVCATTVTLVAECVGTTNVGGTVEIYTSLSTFAPNVQSVSTFFNAASRTVGLIFVLLLSFLAI